MMRTLINSARCRANTEPAKKASKPVSYTHLDVYQRQQFEDKVKIESAAVQKFYDDNKPMFEVAEQVKAEYLVLSLEALLAQVTVSEAEIKTWYESHKDRYQQPEERRASHILIMTNADTDKDKAKAKAEEVLKEVQKSPVRFAELAKQYSQDPGSAQKLSLIHIWPWLWLNRRGRWCITPPNTRKWRPSATSRA